MAKLYFYYAAMNAGKTTILLQSDYNYREKGMETLLFTPIIDTRIDSGKIGSRIGLRSDAFSFNENFDFYKYVLDKCSTNLNLCCIFIDEAQFLKKKQVLQLCKIVDELKIPVLAYGLRSDFLGETFEGSQYLLTWADHLIEIKTICACGRKAVMNQRIDAMGNPIHKGVQIDIGGNEKYTSLCRLHFMQGLQFYK